MDVRPSRPRSIRAVPAALVACLMISGLLAQGGVTAPSAAEALTCPPGYTSYAELKAAEGRAFRGNQGVALAGLTDEMARDLCINDAHPESLRELNAAFINHQAQLLAPAGAVKAGAFKSAVDQRDAIKRAGTTNAAWKNGWKAAGKGPLNTDIPEYGVSALGNGDVAGRITDFEYVAEKNALYASKATGGVWKSTDKGKTWKSIGESLPTQVIGSVAWSPSSGGTLFALSGDNSFGRYSYEGFGSFYSTNDGKTWKRSKGIPDETMGFKIAVDPTNPNEVYAATGAGLYRSTNAGRTFTNVKLPVGDCAGKSNRAKGCLLANIVTDVSIQHPGGVTEVPGGVVVAAVGWREGAQENPDGTVQSPGNGFYISETGAPGSFEKSSQLGFAPQENIGRIEMGAAYGPDQDHNYLYAIVQDAILQTTDLPSIDFPDVSPVGSTPQLPTALNGIYVSSDFGQTWTIMASGLELQEPQTGSALVVVTPALASYGPGIQAWYNMFIQPDPTQATPGVGIPTRLIFGLEEVWQNELPVPQNGKSQFKTIGRYFSGDTCLFLSLGAPVPFCPTDREDAIEFTTTTHPDQHHAAFIPDGAGGVTLVVGNDGGVYRQEAPGGEAFTQSDWGNGANSGFNTLLPYHAAISGDGTIWMGLQDNGTAKILPNGQQIMAQGGDGHFVAVHPDNSKVAFGETPFAGMTATTDGGQNWSGLNPPVTNSQFSNVFVMDPKNPDHIVTAGRQVVETGSGAGTGSLDWKKVFDLGTQDHRGDPVAESTGEYGDDPAYSMTAMDAIGSAIYVGACSGCDALNNPSPFVNGFATNVGGKKPPKSGFPDGWHYARAKGLPNRWISGVAIDPKNSRTVFVTLGGYSRRWTPPGTLDHAAKGVGKGHVYMSTDAGNTFRNISGNLPDVRHTWVELRGNEIIVASDVGIFAKKRADKSWALLGKGLPNVPIHTVELSPRDANLLVAATHGRGVYTYRFGPPKPYGVKVKPFPKPGKIKGVTIAGPFGFEVDEEGWTVASVGNHQWRRQPPGNASSFSFAVMPYADESSTILTSPELRHPGGTVELSWDELRDLESCCDFLTMDWSSDGLKWYQVQAIAGLNEGFPNFSTKAVKFWAPKGSLFVRFRVTSDQLVSFPANQGVLLDNVTVKA
jgi:hypothetical protein